MYLIMPFIISFIHSFCISLGLSLLLQWLIIMAKKKNTVAGSDLGSEFDDLEFGVGESPSFGDDGDAKGGGNSTGDGKGVGESPEASSGKTTTDEPPAQDPKPPRKGKKKGFVSLEDCIEYTKELEENGFFTDNAVTSINIPRKTMKLTSSLAKSLDNVAHYQLVTGILMKILSDNREEVEKIIKEMAEKNTEGLF